MTFIFVLNISGKLWFEFSRLNKTCFSSESCYSSLKWSFLQFLARNSPCTTVLFVAMFHIFAPHLLSYVPVVLSNPEMWKGSLCWTLLGAASWQRLCLAKWFPAKTLCSEWLKAERKWCSRITAFPGCHVRYPSLIYVTVAADQTTQSWHPSPPPHRWSDSGAWLFPANPNLTPSVFTRLDPGYVFRTSGNSLPERSSKLQTALFSLEEEPHRFLCQPADKNNLVLFLCFCFCFPLQSKSAVQLQGGQCRKHTAPTGPSVLHKSVVKDNGSQSAELLKRSSISACPYRCYPPKNP